MRARAWVSVLVACAAIGAPPAGAGQPTCSALKGSISSDVQSFGRFDCTSARGEGVHAAQHLTFADNFLMLETHVAIPTGERALTASAVVNDLSSVSISPAEGWCPGLMQVELVCAHSSCANMSNGSGPNALRDHMRSIGIAIYDGPTRNRIAAALRQIIEGRCGK